MRLQELVECSGYIPKNAEEAKDPRWSRALSVDVNIHTMDEQYKKLFGPFDLHEAFTQPYPMTWEHQDDAHDALVKLPDGSNLSIMFSSDYDGNGEEEWVVEFWRNNSQEVTGEGDAYRIFATVMEAIKQFVQAEEPDKIRFSATKDTESGDRNLSRSNLYNTMVRRYASALGYNAEISDHAGSTVYELYLMG